MALLGLWGLSGRGNFRQATLLRAAFIFAICWFLLLSTGGVGSFFLLWYFVLLSTYPILLPPLPATVFLISVPLSYLLFVPLSTQSLPFVVVFSRVFLLAFIGGLTRLLSGAIHRYLAECRQSEAALQKSEMQLRTLIEQASDGIFIADARGRYLDVNTSGCRMLGYTREELLQLHMIDLIPPEDLATRPLELHKLLAGETLITERRLKRKDGAPLPVEISAKMLPDGRLQGIVRDITSRKKAEEALRASEARFRQLIDHAPEAIVLLDVETGRFVHANPAAERLFKLPAEQLYQIGPVEMSPPVQPNGQPSAQAARQYISQACTGGTSVFEWTHRDATGKDIPCEIRLLNLEMNGRKLLRGSITDITERRRAEKILRESEQRLAFLLQATPVIIYTGKVGGDFATTFISDNVTKQTGYTPRDFYENPDFWLAQIHPDDQARVIAGLEQLLSQGELITEYRFLFKDGRYHWMQDAVRLVQDGSGQPMEIVGYWLDITARKQAEEALRESEEKYRMLFLNNPHPMWVYDRETLAFLAVNNAAIATYGYSRSEFLKMTIKDIRPAEEVPRLLHALANRKNGVGKAGVWRHQTRHGEIIDMEITSHGLIFEDKRAALVSAFDVTRRQRTEAEIQRTNKELTTLLNVSQRLVGQIDLENLLQNIPQYITETLSAAEAGSLWLYDEEQNVMIPTAWIGHDDSELSGLKLHPDTSLLGLIYRTRKPQIIADTSRETNFDLLGKSKLDGIKSVIGAPLITGDKLTGMLFADNLSKTHAFDHNDLRLLQSLANLAALAIKNARLYQERVASEKSLIESRGQLRALAGHLQSIREEERANIAREIHDEFGQILTVLKINLAYMERELQSDRAVNFDLIHKEIESMNDLIDRSVKVMSRMISDLRPEVLDNLGLLEAIEWQAQVFETVTGITCHYQKPAGKVSLGKEKETALFRIVQEGLTNVAKHAHATEVHIKIDRTPASFELQITDNGIGISSEQIKNNNRFGLVGMKERAILLGGEFEIHTGEPQGTTIAVKIPYKPAH